MTDTSPSRYSCTAMMALALVLLGLWGCGAAPVEKSAPAVPAPPATAPPAAEDLVLQLPPSQYSLAFNQAEQLLGQFNWMAASDALAPLPSTGLAPDDSSYLGYLQARIAYLRGHQDTALALLSQLDQPGMNPALRYRTLNLRRHLAELSRDYLGSARLGDQLLQIAPLEDRAALKRGVWRDLQRTSSGQLRQALLEASTARWQAWLELAVLGQSGLADTLRELPAWLENNGEHPAAQPLPGGLAYLLEQSPRLDRVALMLPLSGKLAPAGKAIRDGYLASYYAARAAGEASHEILMLDVDSYLSPAAAYNDAVAQGANMVLGPLSKQAVVQISNLPNRPVPVLALNRPDSNAAPDPGSSAMVQLSLAPEDEATAVAELAFGQGARRALLIRPAGDWGSKVAQALLERWGELGGSVASSVSYSGREDYSASVKTALDIPASEQRARDIANTLATNVEYTTRRRQDVDVIFLLARNGPEARSIKPLLAYHYAGNLPIYAISSIYNGLPDPRDRDLDGINLVETPWLLGANPALRVAIAAGNTGSDNYTRLNALGADAFGLQMRFRQLQAGPDALLHGNTGLLSMDPLLRMRRELSLATFDGGVIQAR